VSKPELTTAEEENTGGSPRQIVRSPEQVVLALPVAGPTSRMLAYAIDFVFLLVLQVGVFTLVLAGSSLLARLRSQFVGLFRDLRQNDLASVREEFVVLLGMFMLFEVAIELAYFVFSETVSGGRSIGKAMVGLRVVQESGLPIEVRHSVVRNLMRSVDVLPSNYLVGLISMIVSSAGQRLGDLAAGTIVVRLDRLPSVLPLREATPEDSSEFRFDRAQIARLGSNERALLRKVLRRCEDEPVEGMEGAFERAFEALRVRIDHEPVPPDKRVAFLRALLDASRRA
jgi:uncharacterized RDD family membrane protein YckC